MNRKEAKELLPIIQAFAEGKPIQYRIKDNKSANWNDVDKNYHDFSPHSFQYRITPTLKCRPFKDADECWQEMQKHQPFGWLKDKNDRHRTLITVVDNEDMMALNGITCWDFLSIMNMYVFVDGTPFGVKIEKEE